MHPSVYAVLTCLYGSSFGAPVGAPLNQATGLLDEVTKGLPINNAAENLIGGIVKRTVVPTSLGNNVPVGQGADGLTGNGVEDIVGHFAKGANAGSVPSSAEKDLLDGLPVGSDELLKGLPLGGKEKRDTGLPVGSPVGSGSELLKGLPVGSGSELLKNIPIVGGEGKQGAGLPVGSPVGSGSELLKDIPIVGGKEKRETGLPLGNVDQVLKPVTGIVDGPLS